MKKSALVIFEDKPPAKRKEWWQQFDVVVAPKKLAAAVKERGSAFYDIDSYLESGSVQKAEEFLRQLSLESASDGRRVTKLFIFKGYELWWTHYSDLMYRFALPYVKYQRLLHFLKGFSKVQFYLPPNPTLFRYFLESFGCECAIFTKPERRVPSLGVLIQVGLSLGSLLCLKISQPKLMVWTSDLFDPPRDCDFRMRFIYEELRKQKLKFVEFIRSMESSRTVLTHAIRRKRPVIYSFAIGVLLRGVAGLVIRKNSTTVDSLIPDTNPERRFRFLVGTYYLRNVAGDVWFILAMRFILKFIKVKAAVIPDASSRTLPEVLACKILNIGITGIQHGATSKYYLVSEFMPEYDGEKSLSVDKYGVWSEGWKEYYLRYSKIYRPEQLFVSGPMRPLLKGLQSSGGETTRSGVLKVLVISEQLAEPTEVLPYLQELLRREDLSVYITFRPYRDIFEKWLTENHPEILTKIGKENILRGNVHESIAKCDIVVGSHSTGVLEALLQLKPFVFFLTAKWGDFFDIKLLDVGDNFFAENPTQLIDYVNRCRQVSIDNLKILQARFFGDPYKNGSKWVVDEVRKFL